MFNTFWEQKNSLIQFLGILCGVGALFLAIPESDNIVATNALHNIQFVWLVIITLSTISLFKQFIILSDRWEKDLRDTKGLDMTETVSLLIVCTLIYLLLNLWKYFLNIYGDAFWDFFKMNNFALISICSALYFHYWRNVVLKIPESSKFRKVSFSLISHFIGSIFLGFIIEISLKGSDFSIYGWIKISTIIIIAVFLLMINEIVRLWKTKK